MNKLLKDITDELFRLNDFLGKKVFSEKDIIAEKAHLKELLETQQKIAQWLKKLKKCSLDDENQFCEKIVELHVLTNNLAWYFENLNENVQKIIKKYPFSKGFLDKNSL